MSSVNDIYRKRWLKARVNYETNRMRSFPFHSGRRIPLKDPLAILLKILGFLLKVTGILKIGRKQALKIELNRNKISSSRIGIKPLRILHISDLHLDEGVLDIELLKWKIKEAGSYHFAVVTGDLVTGWPEDSPTQEKIRTVLGLLKPQYKTLFVLGNHDSHKCVAPLEKMGITVLTNQIYEMAPVDFSYGIQFIGTDDPHYFYTDDSIKVMQETHKNYYKIALVHTPELYKAAQENEIDFYLCGHTHAGQFSLPGGFAPMKRVYRGKRFYKGKWNYKTMNGYTSSGLGTSTITARFFTTAEVTLHEITNKKKET
jgi:predicted MPP superfamily phosphohydrolase